MKPAIFWTLHRDHWHGWEVLEVTSQKGSKVWGRRPNGDTTHRRVTDCTGKFDAPAMAFAAIERLTSIRSQMRDELDVLQRKGAEIRQRYEGIEKDALREMGAGSLMFA